MKRLLLEAIMLGSLALALSGCAQAADIRTAPPDGGYEKVSDLVALPDFIPGMGTLYVRPDTLPAGPFLAYDRDGGLVSTTYMIPLAALDAQRKYTGLDAAPARVDHVDMYYNAGHPGVEEPHYHIVLWHVSEDAAADVQ